MLGHLKSQLFSSSPVGPFAIMHYSIIGNRNKVQQIHIDILNTSECMLIYNLILVPCIVSYHQIWVKYMSLGDSLGVIQLVHIYSPTMHCNYQHITNVNIS